MTTHPPSSGLCLQSTLYGDLYLFLLPSVLLPDSHQAASSLLFKTQRFPKPPPATLQTRHLAQTNVQSALNPVSFSKTSTIKLLLAVHSHKPEHPLTKYIERSRARRVRLLWFYTEGVLGVSGVDTPDTPNSYCNTIITAFSNIIQDHICNYAQPQPDLL